MTDPQSSHVRDHLANERTHLAWLRTALAILTFGIGLNRFSLYLREIAASQSQFAVRTGTGRFGLGMIVVGMVILVWGAIRYERVRRQIDSGDFRAATWSPLIVSGTILVLSAISLWLLM